MSQAKVPVDPAAPTLPMAVVGFEIDQHLAPKPGDLSIQKVREIKAKRQNVKTKVIEYLVEWENKSLEQGQGGNGNGEQQNHKQIHGDHHQGGSSTGHDGDKKFSKFTGTQPQPIDHVNGAAEKQHTEIISERTDDFLMETWEPQHHLVQCQDKIDEFEKEQKKRAKDKKRKEEQEKVEKARKLLTKYKRKDKPNKVNGKQEEKGSFIKGNKVDRVLDVKIEPYYGPMMNQLSAQSHGTRNFRR